MLTVAAIVVVLAVAAPWSYQIHNSSTESLNNTISAHERPREIGGRPRGPPLQSCQPVSEDFTIVLQYVASSFCAVQ